MKGCHKTSQRGVESLAVDATPLVHPYSGCKRKIMDAELGETSGSLVKFPAASRGEFCKGLR